MSTPRPDSWVSEQFGVQLKTVSSPVGLKIIDLVALALRRNPRRAHLLVSTVLGKHIPVDPDLIVGTGRLLGELVRQRLAADQPTDPPAGRSVDSPVDSPVDSLADWPALVQAAVHASRPLPLISALDAARVDQRTAGTAVLGFAETATSLGHLVADQLDARCYLHSTRRVVPGVDIAGTFEEGHSHATRHLLLPLPSSLLDTDEPMVLVDDELSTGKTAMGTIAEAHRRHTRARYVVASLIDLRSPADEAEMQTLAAHLGCQIDVVALVRGTVDLPPDLTKAVANRLVELDRLAGRPAPMKPAGSLHRTDIAWPASVPDGGRHGFLAADCAPFDEAVEVAAREVTRSVRSRLVSSSPVAGSRSVDAGRVVVVGTEELMYLPLRLAQHLRHALDVDVRFQSTTRSPVLAYDDHGYPIRRQFAFADAEGDQAAGRYLYNCSFPTPTDSSPAPTDSFSSPTDVLADPDLIVVVTDAAADTQILHRPNGLITTMLAAGLDVELVVLGAIDPAAISSSRLTLQRSTPMPPPLTGPEFGSYASAEVRWLLTDLSDVDLEADTAVREAAIQAGTSHYAESLPIEFQPDAEYQDLFASVLAQSSSRLATAVGLVTELVLQERGHDIAFASLARAGTPVGILMRRWAAFRLGLTVPHYALSIVRGRGIDTVALRYLAAHHEPSNVVFVDGWTGKGAITKELSAALAAFRAAEGLSFSDDLAVLADPGYCVRTFGTRDDFLIASACLNSTVSGLVSRTVLNDAYLSPGQFHGAKFYRELADSDVSAVLLDAVSASFPKVVDTVLADLPALAASDREPTFAGWAAIEAIRAEYGIESVNFVKPGVGETTRVLLRRVPWRILVREADNPDHEHLRHLAAQRGVPVEVRPDLPYSCVGLIRRLSQSEPDEA